MSSRRRTSTESSPSPGPRRHRALPAFALFGTQATWLEATIFALTAVLAVGLAGALLLAAGRRLRWWHSSFEIRLRRAFRVSFGGLFLAALTIPYLAARAPAAGLALLVLAVVAALALLLPSSSTPPPDRSSGEHAEIE